MIRNNKLEEGLDTPKTMTIVWTFLNYAAGNFVFPIIVLIIIAIINPNLLFNENVISMNGEFNMSMISMETVFIATGIGQLISFILQIFISKRILQKGWAIFSENKSVIKRNMLMILKNFGYLVLVVIFFSLSAYYLNITSSSENQEVLMEISKVSLPFIIALTVVFAPFMEELVFRNCIFAPLRKKHFILAYLVSGFSFGLLHVISSFAQGIQFKEVFFLFQYSAIGIILCKVYEDTGSIWGSIFLHALYNSIAVLALI